MTDNLIPVTIQGSDEFLRGNSFAIYNRDRFSIQGWDRTKTTGNQQGSGADK